MASGAMDNASDYGSELLGSTLGWLTLCFFLRLRQSTANRRQDSVSNQKSNHFYCHITTAQVPW